MVFSCKEFFCISCFLRSGDRFSYHLCLLSLLLSLHSGQSTPIPFVLLFPQNGHVL
nr:MAG TPA: hypothetical protein [Caudoviricetes sp.]